MKMAFRDRAATVRLWRDGRFRARQRAPLTMDETARAAQLDALKFALENAGDGLLELMELSRALADLAKADTPRRRIAEVGEGLAARHMDDVCRCLNEQFKILPFSEDV